MKNEILRKITIVMAIALLLLSILIIVSFVLVSISDTKQQVQEFADLSTNQIKEIKSLSELDKFILYKEGSNIRITIINSNGKVIKDSDSASKLVNQVLTNVEVTELLKKETDNSSVWKIESSYMGKDNMYSFYERVNVSYDVDPGEFIIVRYSMANALSSYAFKITIMALIAFWVVMVISLAVIFNYNIKAALEPLEKTQKVMKDIKEGKYTKSRSGFMTIESEADRMFDEIESIGSIINGSINNLKMIIASLNQGIVAFDQESNIVIKNSKLDEMLGFCAATKQDFYNCFNHNDIIYHIKESFTKGLSSTKEFDHEGKTFKIDIIVEKTYKDLKGGIYMLIVLSDITKEKNDLKFKNEFFANASHELKTPLTAINGYSELMMLDTATESQIKKCAEQINKNSNRMRELIEDMLNLSKLENVKVKTDKEEIIVENIVDMLFEELAVLANKNNVSMERSGHMIINANKKLIIMLIKNLITNAIKYNKQNGSINVILDKKKLIVKDTGIGISKKDQEKIFDRFYKVENANKKQVETSSGLGLALVAEIAKLQNASIEVNSELDKGSEFIITFNQ